MNDLFSLDELSGGDAKFLLDWDGLRRPLKHAIDALAVSRCQEARCNLRSYDKQVSPDAY